MKRQLRPYCPLNGSHGITNGSAPAFPRKPCKHCGFGENLTNFNNYCPGCKVCFTCNRITKRAYSL
jgi:hypothetical protein